MEETTSLVNIIFHSAVFALSFIALIVSIAIWYRKKKRVERVDMHWKMFVYGLFFYSVSEFSDLFTPGLKASLGMHNYFTELALLIGLAFIFISMRRLVVSSVRDE